MKLLPMPRKRNFRMPDETSSCCGARTVITNHEGYQKVYECACCGSELNWIRRHPREANVFIDYKGIFVNDNQYGKRLRDATYRSMYFVGRHGKIVRIERMESLTYNWSNGMLYTVCIHKPGKKMVRNITYKVGGHYIKKEFLKRAIQLRAFYLLPEIDIIRDIEQSLGISDIFKYVDDIYNDMKTDKYVKYILICMAYPKFTWMKCPLVEAPTPRFRKALKTASNKKALFDAYFNGNAGKSLIKFLNKDDNFKDKLWWAIRLLSMIVNKDKLWHLINSGWVINLISERDYDEYRYDMPTTRTIHNFSKEYGVDRLLNHIEDLANDALHRYGLRNYLIDSISMWKSIKDKIPDYTIPRSNSLIEVHNKLARDTRKLAVDNEKIKYSRNEKELNSVYGDIEFVLPIDVHTIIDNGDALGICVGGAGYTSAAVKKKMIILFGMMGGDPVVCMQIQDNKLVQAKMFQNHLAWKHSVVNDAIKKMCQDKRIDCSSCYDVIGNVSPSLYDQEIVLQGGNAPVQAIEEPGNNLDWLF